MNRTVALLAAALVAAPLPALAADVTAHDPAGLLAALGDLGYEASLNTKTNGATTIALTIDGSPSFIEFWNCDDNKTGCETFMLTYGIDLENGTTPEKANEWNYDTIHGFIYLDDAKDPWLNMTVATGDGISVDLFSNLMKTWRTRIGDVRKFFDL